MSTESIWLGLVLSKPRFWPVAMGQLILCISMAYHLNATTFYKRMGQEFFFSLKTFFSLHHSLCLSLPLEAPWGQKNLEQLVPHWCPPCLAHSRFSTNFCELNEQMHEFKHRWQTCAPHQDLTGRLPVSVLAKPTAFKGQRKELLTHSLFILCPRHHVGYILSFKCHNQLSPSFFYWWENWGSEKLTALLTATQLIKE